ncbi:hypothetical protein WKK05_23755 [Nostoc sp. UHCC 0302]|uniref:hypothetical protein n=1 Tax=Nostoc sp. UHCC 0302 TaxID=3134896 RepID=UPI00311CB9DB
MNKWRVKISHLFIHQRCSEFRLHSAQVPSTIANRCVAQNSTLSAVEVLKLSVAEASILNPDS